MKKERKEKGNWDKKNLLCVIQFVVEEKLALEKRTLNADTSENIFKLVNLIFFSIYLCSTHNMFKLL